MITGTAPRIVYVQYTRPDAYVPLEQSSKILISAGWEALFLGTAADGAADLISFSGHPENTVRRLRRCRPGWLQKAHYIMFCFWVLGWVVRWRPQWIYASDVLSCPAVVVPSVLLGARVVYHEHDSPGAAGGFVDRVCMVARKFIARRAQICILPNKERAAQASAQLDVKRVVCVWNCPRRSEVAVARARRRHRQRMTVVYQGSITPERLPATVLAALATLPDTVTLSVVGYESPGSPGYLNSLKHEAFRLGVAPRVEWVGTLRSREELLAHCRRCDVGLALMPSATHDGNLRAMVGASGKVFDYIASGLAVLVSDQTAWRETFVEPGYGLFCNPDDVSSIASRLEWFLEHPDETLLMGERGRQRVLSGWNYEQEFAPVMKVLTGEHGMMCGVGPRIDEGNRRT
jgi:glycosyltransferase involved in cell wall biosynthesis